MISFFTGVPGSGKTYYAVDKIFNNFSTDKEAIKDKKATYEICYTNINEFNFDKVDNVFYLDFDDLKRKLSTLHKYYKEKKDDDFLIEKCKEYKIYNALFVLDEAHNFFDVKDVVLVWWLSYHRHLFHEIILITQNLSLIESKYKAFSEFFYKAFPQSLTLFKTHFKYNVYCNSRMTIVSKSGSIKVKRNKKVFDLYKSGDSINSQNIIFKLLFLALIFLLVVVIVLYFYTQSLKSSPSQSESISDDQLKTEKSHSVKEDLSDNKSLSNEPTFKFKDKKFFKLSCNSSNCSNRDVLLPFSLLTYFIKSNNITLLYSEKINNNYYKFYLDCSEDFYTYISKKGLEYENNNNVVDSDKVFIGK
ncbi:MAG TPA: zonular occludens toxin domain-containing protein [Sulfurimonas sp.]|uniref:zonular occludens toxin domain-containing protein n=1 Tax=Sulfurimonas sp. TaxID=2022749 RepID=UPI002BB7229E|nr:zonular occludens toxin domain-containing protein [Sulfurimonas sp.]HUH41716.1 zonular occludens toxin domain-containing protein [Sulfurimonas sp.]